MDFMQVVSICKIRIGELYYASLTFYRGKNKCASCILWIGYAFPIWRNYYKRERIVKEFAEQHSL